MRGGREKGRREREEGAGGREGGRDEAGRVGEEEEEGPVDLRARGRQPGYLG